MKKKLPIILLTLILLLAAFMRLFNISDYQTFLGDEGRDVMVVKQILEGNFTLLGPRASAGDFFTGPIYYYMMAPFLWLFQLDPVGPAVMVALFGIATVFLLYWVGKKFFNTQTGLIAAALYAVSPLVLTYSRSSWNPNPVPFFVLLISYLLYQAVTAKKPSWKQYVLIGVLLGISLQLHYIVLFFGFAIAIAFFLMHWYHHHKILLFQILKHYLQIFLGFLIGFSPFLAFEVRHGFPNLKTIFSFITSDSTNATYAAYQHFYEPVMDVFFRLFGHLIFHYPSPDRYVQFPELTLQLFGGAVILMAFASIIILFFQKNKLVTILLFVWLFFGIVLFVFYKKPIYDYYFVFMFPLPFLLIANLLSKIAELKNKKMYYGIVISALLFTAIFVYNLWYMPFRAEPNKQKDQVKRVAQFVLSKTDNKPFNFGIISPANSDHGYRYYFDILNQEPTTIENPINDPERKTVTDQLLVVCEAVECKPLGAPSYEIAGFGQADIAEEWSYSVVKVYKLVHKKESK